MLTDKLNKDWTAQRNSVPVIPVMHFAREGLKVGAGTVLAKSAGDARDISIDPSAPRLRALLVAAHLRSPTLEQLSHLSKAAQRWSDGQDSLAKMHLALSGFGKLAHPETDAYRLFLADGLLKAGFEAEAIIDAIEAGDAALDRLQKYNPDQPRVPAGSGRPSGQWTSTDGGSAQGFSPQRGGSPSAVAAATQPTQRSIPACIEAEADCITAAVEAGRNAAANDNGEFLDLKNCRDAGFWCDQLSWIIEDIPLLDHAGVIFPHRGVVLIDKGQKDRYFPPVGGRRPQFRRSSSPSSGLHGTPPNLARQEVAGAEGYSCPPWDPAPDETVSSSTIGFNARLKPLSLLASRANGQITEQTCSLSEQWGKVVRAKIACDRQGSPGTVAVTSWSHPGEPINVAMKLACCGGPHDSSAASAALAATGSR